MTIKERTPAPLFSLPDQHGKTVALEDFRGRDVVVYFYPKDDTPGCTKEACGFRDLWQTYADANVVVLGISPDDAASHKKFAEKYNLPFPILCDPDKRVMQQYGAWGEKIMYGKKTIGVIRSTVWIGKNGEVIKHWRKVPKAADHPQKILQAMKLA